MNEAWRIAGRNAVATAAIALIASVFRFPQPFLAVLVAFILVGGGSLPHGSIPHRLVFAWLGALSGILLATALPEQPWLLLPLFALMIAAVLHYASLKNDPSISVVALIAAAAGVPSGIIDPAGAISAGFFHGINVTCGILCAALAFFLIPAKDSAPPAAPVYPFRRALIVGGTSAVCLVCAALFFPFSAVIMVIAGTVMAFNLMTPGAPPLLGPRTVGAIGGVLLSLVFDVIVSSSGNNIAIFLVGLAAFFGAFAWLGIWRKDIHPYTAQAASVFAIAAPMIPRPDSSLQAMAERTADVLLGCAVGIGICLIHAWAERQEGRQLRCGQSVCAEGESG